MKRAVTIAALLGLLVFAGPAGAPPPGSSPPPQPLLFGEYQVSRGVLRAEFTANQLEHGVKANRVLLEERRGRRWLVRDRVKVSRKQDFADAWLRWVLPLGKRKVITRVRSVNRSGTVATVARQIVYKSGRALRAKAVSSGYGQSCALFASHKVKCWGLNRKGELGTGNRRSTTRPVAVRGLGRVRSVAASDGYTCAIRWRHRLACWGGNHDGVLGSGDRNDSLVPRNIKGLKNVRQVSTAPANACALTGRGRVYCWGSNGARLGQEGWRLKPVRVKGVAGVAKVVAGSPASCAVLKSGKVTCWSNRDLKPKPRNGLGRVRHLLLADQGGCAIRPTARLVCWGDDDFGQLGNGPGNRYMAKPRPVKRLGKVKSVGGRDWTRCAVEFSGRTWCWGFGNSGALGNGRDRDSHLPVRVRGLTDARSVASPPGAGNCAARRNRTIVCWGDNSAGSVGNGTRVDQLTPVPVLVR